MNITTTLLALLVLCDARDDGFTGIESSKRYLVDTDECPHSEKFPHKGCIGLLRDRVPLQPAEVGPKYQAKHLNRSYNVDNEVGITAAKCRDGMAAGYPCNNVGFLSVLDLGELNFGDDAVDGIDVWGWHKNGREFALMLTASATVFVEITNPTKPVIVGKLAAKTKSS